MFFWCQKHKKYSFQLDGNTLEIVETSKYLGVYFSKNRTFLKARTHVIQQARKALHLLYKLIRYFNLSINPQIKLFDYTIVPILLYGSEIWALKILT